MSSVFCTALILLGSGLQAWSQTGPSPSKEREITWKQLIPNVARDQKRIWSFPIRLAQGKHLAPTLAVSGLTTGLVFADPVAAPYFRHSTTFKTFNSIFTTNASALIPVMVPVSLYLAGSIRKDSYARETALLTAEAIANVQIISLTMHTALRRSRPSQLPYDSAYGRTWFQKDVSLKGSGSFPSGHAMTAFAVAAVTSRRYPRYRWLPYVAYTVAGAVSFSRLTTSSHFLSDVFFGSALGYTVGRFTVPAR
ncbi:MAG: phosphatase PAP2 family protein [Bryobacteraceae bacterium]